MVGGQGDGEVQRCPFDVERHALVADSQGEKDVAWERVGLQGDLLWAVGAGVFHEGVTVGDVDAKGFLPGGGEDLEGGAALGAEEAEVVGGAVPGGQGAHVTFEPGARTAWHTHPLGQTLIVTSGLGRVQRAGGPVEEIRPGDVVWFEPGEKHWHGAAPATAMTHIALQEVSDGKVVDWLEHVSDADYGA